MTKPTVTPPAPPPSAATDQRDIRMAQAQQRMLTQHYHSGGAGTTIRLAPHLLQQTHAATGTTAADFGVTPQISSGVTVRGGGSQAYRDFLERSGRAAEQRFKRPGGTKREDFVSFYDEARRALDMDKLEAGAKDNADERGDITDTDGSVLGPTGAPSVAVRGDTVTQADKRLTPTQLGMAAAVAFLLLGG